MSFLVARSVPLGETTREALKSQGAIFLSRDRTPESMREYIMQRGAGFEFIWNMGVSGLSIAEPPVPMYNDGSLVIETLKGPSNTREFFGDLMPTKTGSGEYVWEKRHGRGGRGKIKHRTEEVDLDSLEYWEDHVAGQEYRLIMVSGKIVGAHERNGDNANRSYRFVPLSRVPNAIKRIIRKASSRLPDLHVVAWDAIGTSERVESVEGFSRNGLEEVHEGRAGESTNERPRVDAAFVFEGNSSPGLNSLSAERIVKFIRGGDDTDARNE